MERVDQSRGVVTKSTNSGGAPMEGVKFASQIGNNDQRRALRDIKNFVGAPPFPCAVIKKGLTDKIAMENKNPNTFAGRRPITRKFAASLANNHQKPSSTLEPIVPVSSSNNLNPSDDIDVDDYKSASDHDLPLPMIEEKEDMDNCHLEEVGMEVDPFMDIDACDSNNPLAVVQYVDEIYSFYRQTEELGCVSPNYISNQSDINEKMRAILIDWLIEVHYKFELMDETLYLTVNIIDRFLAQQSVVRKKLQLVGVTALLLACKYEEVSVPVVEDLILISDRAYTREELLEMERLIVNTLHFNMSVPTPFVFMRRFLKAAQCDKKLELLSSFIVELSLVEYQMLQFRPSLLAAAAVYTAQCALKGFKHWTKTSEMHSGYSENELRECSQLMVDFHQKAGTGKLTGVHRKYSTFKFGCTAKSEPALFLLDKKF